MGDAVALREHSEGSPPRPRSRRGSLRALASDEQLAKAVARGHEDAFAELYRRHHQPLYRYCRSILRDGEEAQDALQSAMTNAFVALQRRERDLAVRPWLFRIAHNEAITLLRRRRTRDVHLQRVAAEATGRQGVAPGEVLEQRERLQLLLTDLAALAERQRAALLMRELSGLSIEEIAGALAITPGAAKQALFEARGALKDLAEGRTMDCESIQSLIDGHDGRVLRSRLVRSHLRSCASCRELERSIAERSADLRALAPPLPAIAGGALLARVLTGAGGSHGAAVAAGGAGAAAGGAGAGGVGLGSGAAGTIGGVANGGTGGGLAGVLGGSVAAKGAVAAAVVVLAAGGAVRVLSGGRGGSTDKAALGRQLHSPNGSAKSVSGAHPGDGAQTQRRHRTATGSGPNAVTAPGGSSAARSRGRGATSGGVSKAVGTGRGASPLLGSAGAPGVRKGASKHHASAPRRAHHGSEHGHAGGGAGVKSTGRGSGRSSPGAARHGTSRSGARPGSGKSPAKSSPQSSTETEVTHHRDGGAGGGAASESASTSTTASTGPARRR